MLLNFVTKPDIIAYLVYQHCGEKITKTMVCLYKVMQLHANFVKHPCQFSEIYKALMDGPSGSIHKQHLNLSWWAADDHKKSTFDQNKD